VYTILCAEKQRARAEMELDDDEWELSAEEMDSLERDAFEKIAQLQRHNPNSSSSSSTAPLTCSYYNNNKQPPPPQQQQEQQQRSLPSKPTTDSSSKKV
jgi:hypothetical protein